MIKSIQEKITTETIINKSKFISVLYPISDINEVNSIIQHHKLTHLNATHHCFAYIIGSCEKANDDGEPSGTAGLPILNVLKKNDIQNILAIVTRYFGGVKLGAGGLVRAYSQSTSASIKEASIVYKYHVPLYEFSFDYPYIGQLDYLLNQANIPIINKKYEEKVIYSCYLFDETIINKIQDITSNQFTKKLIQYDYISLPEVNNVEK